MEFIISHAEVSIAFVEEKKIPEVYLSLIVTLFLTHEIASDI